MRTLRLRRWSHVFKVTHRINGGIGQGSDPDILLPEPASDHCTGLQLSGFKRALLLSTLNARVSRRSWYSSEREVFSRIGKVTWPDCRRYSDLIKRRVLIHFFFSTMGTAATAGPSWNSVGQGFEPERKELVFQIESTAWIEGMGVADWRRQYADKFCRVERCKDLNE